MQIAEQAAITEKLHKLNWLRTIQQYRVINRVCNHRTKEYIMKLIDLEFLTELSDEELALQAVAGGNCDPYTDGSNLSEPSSGSVLSGDTSIISDVVSYLDAYYPTYDAAYIMAINDYYGSSGFDY